MTSMAIEMRAATAPVAAMRAVVQSGYGDADVWSVGSAPRPTAGAGEVLVRVRAAGLDRGTWHLMTGRPYLMRIMGFGFWGPKSAVPGLDLSGIVEAVGPGVTRFAVGDAVLGIGRGSFAELACAREDKLVHKPEELDFAQAAVLGVSGLTALQSLRDAGKLVAGERVLVIGASGGVGTYAVQIARAMGAEVTGVCSADKMELVRSLGAHHVVDRRAGDFMARGERYDLVLDLGGNLPLARLRRGMTEHGRLVFVGGENGGDWTAGFGRPLAALAMSPFTRQRFAMFAAREHHSDLAELTKLVREGKLAPSIDRRCTLDEAKQAMRDLEAGRVRGKLAIVVSSP